MRKPFLTAAMGVALAFGGTFPHPLPAQTPDDPGAAAVAAPVTDRLVILGSGQAAGVLGGISQLVMPRLPEVEAAKAEFLSAVLRSTSVSSFVAEPEDLGGNTGQLFLRIEAEVGQGNGGLSLSLGGESLSLTDFGARLRALVAAVAPEDRRVAIFHLADPGGLFAGQVSAFQQAVSGAGFAMVVAEIGTREPNCQLALAPDVALIAGLADRAPFGDGDGETSAAEAEAWLLAAMERPGRRAAECNATYALIVRADADPGAPVARAGGAELSADLESQLYRETFEAKFLLGSEDAQKVENFLDSCIYCPSEPELTEKLASLRQFGITRDLEASIWAEIKEDQTPERLEIYLANCGICADRAEAETLIATLRAKAAAREAEAEAFAVALAARDLDGLRAYAETCVACDEVARARSLIAEIEADAAYRAEVAALEAATAGRDRAALAEWLESCTTCAGRAGAEALVEELRQAETLIGPCLVAAGLPQQGGPRQLTDIDIPAARAACVVALAELPTNIQLQVVAARIDQAEGLHAQALAIYDEGVAAGLPEAHGLAAYLRFAPADGSAPDLVSATEIAQAGAERGDWLSKEILMLLYSRELVAGHGAAEAVEIARGAAGEGNVVAQFFLGYFLQSGIGTEPDEARALEWLGLAVDAGYVRAQPFLAQIYEQGRAVPADHARAAALLWSALEAGDAVAITRLTDQLSDRPSGVILIVQQNLRDLGVYSGRADGIAGPSTARAVRAYVDSLNQ
ncbi:peptidoglycan-binding protein [Pseudogemmobacter sonorensis]|uniref:peptidoglycan-binding protein n=1 Tax=Pseudogemmobacter sonorensis TaxID=2989681 RepID=UPI0036C15B8A